MCFYDDYIEQKAINKKENIKMKKLLATILCCAMLVSVTACSSGNVNNTEPTSPSATTGTTEPTQTVASQPNDDIKEEIAKQLENFKGIVYLTHNGTVIHSQAIGKDEAGADLTIDSPMYIGSVSKQFCATAIMILKEQGKLSVDDTLDKYFPEYELGKDITIKNLLTMRSGIPELGGTESYSTDKTESENIAIIKEWVFEQPLNFDVDTNWEYSNTNYFLLGNIVEIVSGQHYNDFIRENIFVPLKMEHSGFVNEVTENDFFSAGLTYNTFECGESATGVTKGAGDIVTTAPDMDKWMTGLRSGKIISKESLQEMTADYSPDMGENYGYALEGMYKKGKGHSGRIGNYISLDYFNDEYGYNLFVSTSNAYTNKMLEMPKQLMDILISD